MTTLDGLRVRYEDFGAIVAMEDPPALAWVGPDFVTETLGLPAHSRWEEPAGHLSAPTEVHLMTTNRCPAGCPGCYTSATPESDELSTNELKSLLDGFADAGIFHIAMGGGESLTRADLFELAAYARERGLVPNLTTSGIGMTRELAGRCRVFGQVNVSLDGIGAAYQASRGYDGATAAIRTLGQLADAGVPTGVNFVLSRMTWDHLEATFAAVSEAGGNEIEILRFKPAGRGKLVYDAYKLTPEQRGSLLDTVLELARKYPDVVAKIDCSLVPFLCSANPDPAVLAQFGIFGCEASNALSAVDHQGRVLPCSFLAEDARPSTALFDEWSTDEVMKRYRSYHQDEAPEPCRTCDYRTLCKGGCRAVSAHVLGTPFAPDPECPRVVAHEA